MRTTPPLLTLSLPTSNWGLIKNIPSIQSPSNKLLIDLKTNFNEIKIHNLYLRSQIKNLTYSGLIADLDLSNVYFSEIQNIEGGFSGKNTNLKFDIFSNNSFIPCPVFAEIS